MVLCMASASRKSVRYFVTLITSRQVAPTLCSHKAHVFAVELAQDEIEWLRSQAGVCRGVDDNERTYVEIWHVKDLMTSESVDWGTVGMVLAALEVGADAGVD